MNKLRSNLILTQALIISGGLNILFLGFFFYLVIFEPPQSSPPPPLVVTSTQSPTIQLLHELEPLTHLPQFLPYLQNTSHLEQGYSTQEFTLAYLVKQHHLDILKALTSYPTPQLLKIVTPQHTSLQLPLYLNLQPHHFHLIQDLIRTEQWPLTPQGIYQAFQQQHTPSLFEALQITPLYPPLEQALDLSSEQWHQILTHLPFETLEKLLHQLDTQQVDIHMFRRNILKKTLRYQGAQILIETDPQYCLQKADDHLLTQILENLNPQHPQTISFAQSLLESPRNDHILTQTLQLLHTAHNIPFPQNPDLHALKLQFLPTPHPTQTIIYTVQPGDSLWKIAQQFQTTPQDIIDENQLSSTQIQVHSQLIIPNYEDHAS